MEDFERQAKDLQNRFLERGYPERPLKEAYMFARTQNRESILILKKKKKEKTLIRPSGTYDKANREVLSILNKHWEILHMDEDIMY